MGFLIILSFLFIFKCLFFAWIWRGGGERRLHDLRDKRNISATHWNKGTGGNAAEKNMQEMSQV